MTEKINAEVNLNFVGESKAVKELGGILVKNLTAIKIECLPVDLIHEIDVDISPLQTFDDAIRVKHLKLPEAITINEKEDEVIVSVQPPRSEEELKSLEEKVEEKVEEIGQVEEKKEEEAPAAAEVAADQATQAPTIKDNKDKKDKEKK
jgi:large subunit ribosomal protein L25